jgi:hypothetical protein
MQLQTMRIAAEGVGQDDVGARVHEPLVQPRYLLGALDGPEFWRLSRRKPGLEVVRACGTVGQQNAFAGEQIGKGGSHPRNDIASASDESRMMTGAEMKLDGGLSAM